MRRSVILSAILFSSLFYNSAKAQISVHIGFNIPVHRVYAPAPPPQPVMVYDNDDFDDSDDYYYLPEVEAYYSIPRHCYYYMDGGRWVSASYLPGAYRNYDWRSARRYEVRARRPYFNHDVYRNRWGGDFNRGRDWSRRGNVYAGRPDRNGGVFNRPNNDRGGWNRPGDNRGGWNRPGGDNHGRDDNWGNRPNNNGGWNRPSQPNRNDNGGWGRGQQSGNNDNNGRGNHGGWGGGQQQPSQPGRGDNNNGGGWGQPGRNNDGGNRGGHGNRGGFSAQFAQNNGNPRGFGVRGARM